MISFQYTRANDIGDAVRQIAGDSAAKFIAGGTNLLDLMKEDVERPTRLIDLPSLRPASRASGPTLGGDR